MNSLKPQAARFYRLKSGHAPVGMYSTRFGDRDDNKCWWSGGGGRMVVQTREHLFRHCSRWKDQQRTLWNKVGKATGWRACRCQHMQVSELLISKKHFRPGGMALSEWTRSVRAVRDTPVADYSTPGVNATRRVAYCSPNAVWPFLLAQSVS